MMLVNGGETIGQTQHNMGRPEAARSHTQGLGLSSSCPVYQKSDHEHN